MRLAESQRGADASPATFYTVRVMRDEPLDFQKGDFVRCTGKLKVDFYLSREGKPTGTLLILAFEATKIAKQPKVSSQAEAAAPEPTQEPPRQATVAQKRLDWID